MFGNAQDRRAVRDTMDDSKENARVTGVGLHPNWALGMSLAIAILIAIPAAAVDGTGTTYSGRAFGVSVHMGPLDAKFADTGDLPPEGGVLDATVLTVQTDLAQAEVLMSVTMGFENKAQSEAATAAVTLLPESTNEIRADFVRAESVATCSGVSGSSELVELRLGGQPVVVSGSPNQVIGVPGVLQLVINEQIDSSHDRTAAITVNALHLTLVTGDEVIVSSAHSDITCGQGAPTPKDFVTGGGFIETPDGKANFGFVAGFKPGQPSLSGAVNYLDHAAGIHVKASTVTGYRGEDRARTFSGDATVNGESGFTYTVTAADIAEPGRGADSFEIWVSNGYHAYGKLAGGNIQLHG